VVARGFALDARRKEWNGADRGAAAARRSSNCAAEARWGGWDCVVVVSDDGGSRGASIKYTRLDHRHALAVAGRSIGCFSHPDSFTSDALLSHETHPSRVHNLRKRLEFGNYLAREAADRAYLYNRYRSIQNLDPT
jgi:hypothetical protein